jgi:hypothetical protein
MYQHTTNMAQTDGQNMARPQQDRKGTHKQTAQCMITSKQEKADAHIQSQEGRRVGSLVC